jgi:hypothetical protein
MTAMETMIQLRDLAVRRGLGNIGDFQGLSASEIADVAADQGVALPAVYVAFLQVMGRKAGRLFVGTDALFPQLIGLKRDATALLDENEAPFRLEPCDVVVYMHQGYIFGYLRGSGEDPQVFEYKEGEGSAIPVGDTLSGYLEDLIRQTTSLG